MKRFIEAADRFQFTLLPECLDDWVDEDNPVRVIDSFVDALDLKQLCFDGIEPEVTGRPSYHPSALLKLYIYGYLNRIQSSRRLEREACRNLEVIWLLRRLSPDDKTIADFRKDNGPAIKKVCAKFVELCRQIGLLTKASVAIDGSKFKAVNTRDKNFTKGKVERRRQQLEDSVARYLAQLDTADLQDPSEALAAKTAHLKDKLAKLASEMQKLEAYETAMMASPDQQISLTDPDCRSMATSGRGSGVVGYNVQVAVDTEHHLIIAHEVTNSGSDRAQLANMATQAKVVLGVDKLEAVADRGYYSGEEIKACEDADIAVTLPKPATSGMEAKGQFGKHDFVYLADDDAYRCPAGEVLSYHSATVDDGRAIRRYWTRACVTCPLKARCTKAKYRVISRWEHEHVMEAAQKRLDENPQAMRQRRETVEHPFGTLKMRMGATHFLMKRLPKVATEMALHVLAYNLTRVMNIMGVKPLIAGVRA
jgi:transposase